ncbi:MAG: hypothetical protein AAGG45_03015 [Pseudomonadota bacterium]
MRFLVIGCASVLTLAGCATVSMAPAAQVIVSSSVTENQSEFRETCSEFSNDVYERDLITKRNGVSQVFNMLAFGDRIETKDTAYFERVQIESAPVPVVYKTVEADAQWATRNLNDITGQVAELLEIAALDDSAMSLRKDLVAFEEVLVLSKKVRLSFIDVMSQLESGSSLERNAAEVAIADYEAAIDKASKYIDRLSDAYAQTDSNQATS